MESTYAQYRQRFGSYRLAAAQQLHAWLCNSVRCSMTHMLVQQQQHDESTTSTSTTTNTSTTTKTTTITSYGNSCLYEAFSSSSSAAAPTPAPTGASPAAAPPTRVLPDVCRFVWQKKIERDLQHGKSVKDFTMKAEQERHRERMVRGCMLHTPRTDCSRTMCCLHLDLGTNKENRVDHQGSLWCVIPMLAGYCSTE